MTWTKFGTEFRDECAEAALSDAAFRTHVEAIMYLFGIESMDMRIQRRLVRKWAGSDHYQAAVDELVARGFWIVDGDDWRVVHHEDVFRQSLGYQLRERDRAKKAMGKKRAAGAEADQPAASVTPSVTPSVTQSVTRNEMRTQSVSQTYRQSSTEEGEVQDERTDFTTGEILPIPRRHDPMTNDQGERLCPECWKPLKAGQARHPACLQQEMRRPA